MKLASLITLTLIFFHCAEPPRQEPKLSELIVGQWKYDKGYPVDSVGNPRKLRSPKPNFPLLDSALLEAAASLFGPPSNLADTLDWGWTMHFNSSNEVYIDWYNYGMNYYIDDMDSIFEFFDKYRVVELNDSIMSYIPVFKKSGRYHLNVLKRVDHFDIESSRAEMKALLPGKWKCAYAYQVKTEGKAYWANEGREKVVDTLSPKVHSEVVLQFDEQEFRMSQEGSDFAAVYQYDVADSMIISDFKNLFTILEISQDSLSLLGIHTPKSDINVYRFYRTTDP